MSDWWMWLFAAVAVIAFVYVLVRAGSLAHYRTRAEYDRNELPTKRRREEGR